MWRYKVSTEHRLATVNRPSMTKHLNYPACVVHTCSFSMHCAMVLNYLILGLVLLFFSSLHFISMFILRVQFDFFFACTRSTKCKNPTENREKQKKEFIYAFVYSVVVQSLFTLDAINKIVFNSHNNFHTNAVLQRRMTEFHFALHKQILEFVSDFV